MSTPEARLYEAIAVGDVARVVGCLNDASSLDADAVEATSSSTPSPLLLRDANQCTPLGVAIKLGNRQMVETFLERNAATSVFVKGYSPNSLVCTLPMATQPPSSIVSHPEPLRGVSPAILRLLDDNLAINVGKMLQAQKDKEEHERKEILRKEHEAKKKALKAAAATAGPGPVSTFNHYPSSLNVGDIVRRGPGWASAGWTTNQDESGGVSQAGIVKKLPSGGSSSYSIEWCTDVTDPSTAFHRNSYSYNSASTSPELFVVDPAAPSAKPANAPAAGSSVAKVPDGDKFKLGDRVRLVYGCEASSCASDDVSRFKSACCLGAAAEARIGVVVKVSTEIYKGKKAKHSRYYGPTEADTILSVMALNGKICEYASSDLRYADGSANGQVSSAILKSRNIPGNKPAKAKSQKPSGMFAPGDKVKLRPICPDRRGCLGEPSLNQVGIVMNVSGSTVTVMGGSGSFGGSSGPFGSPMYGSPPQHNYPSHYLMHESESDDLGELPLQVGDRVVLSPSYKEHNKNGWCLGSVGDDPQIVGLVLFASSPIEKDSKEQREVVVAALDEPSKYFTFKSSWLERATNDGGTKFEIGDRVQLDVAKYLDNQTETAGKCLGSASHAIYGRVCAVGAVRDGMQRNIEVVAIGGPRSGSVSMYPSYSLVHAQRSSVLTDHDATLLEAQVSKFTSMAGIDPATVGAGNLVSLLGFGVWDRVLQLARDLKVSPEICDSISLSWQEFEANRRPSWPKEPTMDALVGISPSIAKKYVDGSEHKSSGDEDEGAADTMIAYCARAPVDCSAFWKCASPKCPFDKNPNSKSACVVCKLKAPKWRCEGCSTPNKIGDHACVSCFTHRAKSVELGAAKEVARKIADEQRMIREQEEARLKREKEEIEETMRQAAIEEERAARAAKAAAAAEAAEASGAPAAEPLPEGRFLHPGSWTMCGGNPSGFACCAGAGVCGTTPPNKCVNCGANTNWTCCSSTDVESTMCPETFTLEQAENNARILATKAEKPTLVSDIPGFFSLEVKVDWSCPICTSINSLETRVCEVCNEGVRPEQAKPKPPATPGTAEFNFGGSGARASAGGPSFKFSGVADGGGGKAPAVAPEPAALVPVDVRCMNKHIMKKVDEGSSGAGHPCNDCSNPVGTAGTGHFYACIVGSCREFYCKPCYEKKEKKLRKAQNKGAEFETIVSPPLLRLAAAMSREKELAKKDKDDSKATAAQQPDKKIKGGAPPPTCPNCNASGTLFPSSDDCDCCSCNRNLDGNDLQSQCSSCNADFCDNCVPVASLLQGGGGGGGGGGGVAEDDDDDDDAADDDEDEDDEDEEEDADEAAMKIEIPDDLELKKNTLLAERYYHDSPRELEKFEPLGPPLSGGAGGAGLDATDLDLDDIDAPPAPPKLLRQTSTDFYGLRHYEPIVSIGDLIAFVDKNGNGAAHHAASMGLTKTAEALIAAGASKWLANNYKDTPAGLLSGLPLFAGAELTTLHKAISKHNFLSAPEAIAVALRTPFDYTSPANFEQLVAAIKGHTVDEENNAAFWSSEAVAHGAPHAKLYRAVFYLFHGYGVPVAKPLLKEYLEEQSKASGSVLDPLYFFASFLLWKKLLNNGKPSHAKIDKLLASDALTAFRLYPRMASEWLDPKEQHDADVAASGIDTDDTPLEVEDDDYSDLFPPPGPNDPESVWIKAKKDYNLESKSMDELMKLTGLKEIKDRAISVALTVLLEPPPTLQTGTCMNFLFVGNPGSGKTTVATLLAQSLVELGYRKNPSPVLTTADEILSSGMPPPAATFAAMAQAADGGTLFIDEAYLFNPAPKGSAANDSNKVLNCLMKVSETMRLTTSFILAGYKDEIQTLLSYNQGFASRFPKKFTFDFVDFTEVQLTKILHTMATEKGYRFESKKECGVPIARVLARRIARGANKKGFGNARDCKTTLEDCIMKQQSRHVRLRLNNVAISEHDYRTLTRGDTVGERPRLEDSPYMRELMGMVGLAQVKETVANLMNLQLQNYDAEMRGEQIQLISLHRLFLGNPGTGKTTVAKLYGKMLKEFGFLSDGDFIMTTPSELKGRHQGDAAVTTRELLNNAKGKVLFIDEAYNLDPMRSNNSYGGEVIDTLVEGIEGNAGSDMCVILAGYQPQIEAMIRNCKNPGLKGRFNAGEALFFEDFTDEDIKKVLKAQVVAAGLICEPSTLDYAISIITKKRMDEGFRNAGEAEQILGRAKLRLSSRLSKNDPPVANAKLLIPSDFAGEEVSLEKARDAFAGLENVEHLLAIVDKYEAMVETAKEEGKKPHEVMSNCHGLFLGPPGTGKTTSARRFAQMFKQLEILPTDRCEIVTAGNLLDRYMGGTSNNTLEAMRRAKGGILFIDEAYGMLPRHGSYGGEIIQTLLDNATSEEFKGKIIIFLGGYEDHITQLFETNPGFQSRFDKQRVYFPPWNGEQACKAVCNAIKKDGKDITEEASLAMAGFFETYSQLPNWASARDAIEFILPTLEAERATRSHAINKARRELEEAAGGARGGGGGAAKEDHSYKAPVGSAARGAAPPPIPYELSDVQKVFEVAIRSRGGDLNGGPPSRIRKIYDRGTYNEIIKTAAKNDKILVINFTSPATCPHCVHFQPVYEEIANDPLFKDVNFAIVDAANAEAVFSFNKVDGVPTTRIYLKGQKEGADVAGNNGPQLRSELQRIMAQVARAKRNAAPVVQPVYDTTPSGGPAGPNISSSQLAREKPPQAIARRIDGGDDEEPEEKGNETDFWAALEAACAELGWPLTKIKEMLEDEANFPPPEIMAIIQRMTGATNPSKIKAMLQQQRKAVLEKIKISIKEAEKEKTEEEAKIQTKLRTLGRCPMGFEWLREGGGWRCAGGSHFCSNQELEAFMNDGPSVADEDLYS